MSYNNQDVITAFINHKNAHTAVRYIISGYRGYKGSTLSTDGEKLINYNTVIARWENGKVKVNDKHYSSTTTRIQGALKGALARAGIETVAM